MAVPVLSTYRLATARPEEWSAFTFADAENLLDYLDDLGVSHLYLSPILTAAHGSTHGYDVTDPTTVSAELGGADGLARLSAAARSPRHGPDRRYRAQPRRRRRPRAEPVVVGCAAARPEFAVRHLLRHRLGRWTPTAESCCRCWVPTTTSPTSKSTATCCGSATWRSRSRRAPAAGSGAAGARPSALPADRLAQRRVRLPAVLLDHLAGRAAPGGSGRSSTPATSRCGAGSPKDWSTGCASTIPTDCPIPAGYLAWLRELVGRDAYIVIEKILAVDEALEPTLSGRRHHRLRRAARDRRGVRRPHRAARR